MRRAERRVGVAATADPLLAAVADLWPGGTLSTATTGTEHSRFWVVPGAGGVGSAVPADARAGARAVRRSSDATSPGRAAVRLVLSGALRVGAGGWLPRGFGISGGEADSLPGTLASVLGQPISCAVAIGSDRVNRKRVLEVFDASGRSIAFAKVGGTSRSDADVTAEASALAWWTGRRVLGLSIPQLVWAGDWRGAAVLVVTPVRQGRAGWRPRRAPVAEMAALIDVTARGERSLPDSPWFLGVGERLGRLTDPELRVRALACWESLGDRASGPVSFAGWHGDWTPWNMARHRAGLSLWDWERFAPDVPAGLDLVHHQVNARLSGTPTVPRLLDVLAGSRAGWQALGPRVRTEHEVGIGCYLAEILARYLPLTLGPGGDVLAPRAEALLTAWQQTVGRRSAHR